MERRGPFGLWKGMSLDDFGTELVEIAPYKYRTDTPPKAHSAFDFYVVQISPTSGLAWIKAIGKNISTNGFGTEVLTAFNSMESKLSATYGRTKKTDMLLQGSIWNEPREWMQALQKRERLLFSNWEFKTGAKLGDGISSVFLGATAVDTETGYISIEYSFDNFAQSESEIGAAEDDAL